MRQGRMRRGIEGAWSKERERRNCGNRQQWVLTRVSQNGNMAWPASSNGGPPMAIAAFTTPKSRHKALDEVKHLVVLLAVRRRLALVISAFGNKQLASGAPEGHPGQLWVSKK